MVDDYVRFQARVFGRPVVKRESCAEALLYREDLAHIHMEGYGFHWAGAAAVGSG